MSVTSGLQLWNDFTNAANLTLVSGAISQANDLSGNGNHLVQATAGNRPLHAANGGQNNLGYANFNSVSKSLLLGSLVHAQPYTMYIVFAMDGYSDNARIVELGSGITFGLSQKLGSVTKTAYALVADVNWTPRIPYHAPASFGLAHGTYNFGGSVLRYNKVLPSLKDSVGGPGNTSTAYFKLGGGVPQRVHEVLFYNRAIYANSADDLAIKAYLYSKYQFAPNNTLVAFGDSITQGTGNSTELTKWSSVLAARLGYIDSNQGISSTTMASVGGVTGQNGRDRYTYQLMGGSTNDTLVIMYGTNDGNDTAYQTDYTFVMDQVIAAGYDPNKIVLCSPITRIDSPAGNGGLTGKRNFVQALASSKGCHFADTYQAYINAGTTSLMADNTHPNDAGHQLISDTVYNALTA